MAEPDLKMYRSDTPTVEVGTEANPLDFGLCNAGETTVLPYDIILWNDKGNVLGSEDAYDIYIELIYLYVTQTYVSTGLPNQTQTMTYIPVVDDDDLIEVTVNGTKWTRVASLTGHDQDAVYTIDAVTGVLLFGDDINGGIPPNGETISITYTPDKDEFGKTVFDYQWIWIKSLGIVYSDISVTVELGTKVDNSNIQIIHYPTLSAVVGVWDNVGKTGTNYYTGGSFDGPTGVITLGTPLTDPNAYVEYSYRICDDNDDWEQLGDDELIGPLTRIPKNNAKKLLMKVTVPATASTLGGVYIRTVLRITYKV
jgi:hypothetical protein